MKDKKLEEQFNGYFEGINPPENLAEDAKKYVKAPSRLPRFAKFASIAASVVLVVTAAILIILNPFAATLPDGEIQEPDTSDPALYYEKDISLSRVNGYSLGTIDPALKFLESFAYASNADLRAERAVFDGGETAFIRAEILQVAGARYETEIFVDFSGKIYEPLSAYTEGEQFYYGGVPYRLTRSEVNGEPNGKVYFQKDGLNYFISVTSSDTSAHLKYLDIIF